MPTPRIVIVGAGYAGMYTAWRLQRTLRSDEATVTVVDPRSYMTYQPLLSEAVSGSVEPRHVVVPLREALPQCEVLTGSVTGIDSRRREVTVEIADGHVERLGYDVLVVAPGSVSKTLPVPGLSEHGIGFTNLEEAIYLRNHVLSRLDRAAATGDPRLRDRLLTFVLVGGGYAGVEALGELEDMTRFALRRHYPALSEDDARWVLVEAADRIMPEVSRRLAEDTVRLLQERGVEVRLGTTVRSMEDGHVVLDDDELDADTVVWTAGVSPHPMIENTDLPRDDQGRVRCRPTLEVEHLPGVFAAGDSAAVPDLTADEPGATCPPTAQHAVRQAARLADNIAARLRGESARDYRHVYAGSVASLGLHQGVAEVYGVRVRGWPAWLMHRAYHLARIPLPSRKVRVLADWLLALPFPREVVALGELHRPRAEFAREAERAVHGAG